MTFILVTDGQALVQANVWILVGVAAITMCALVTAAKGRYGWLVAGALVGGLIWPVSACLPATDRSLWVRIARRLARDPTVRRR